MLTLTWAASATKRVRLGTSVLVLPLRHPLPLAKELATLQNLSGGRLILGGGVGWLEAKFDALSVAPLVMEKLPGVGVVADDRCMAAVCSSSKTIKTPLPWATHAVAGFSR